MKTVKRLFLIVFAIELFFISCDKDKREKPVYDNVTIVDAPIKHKARVKNPVHFMSCFSTDNYVELSNSDKNSLVDGRILDIRVDGDTLFLLDHSRIMLFDHDGNYIRTIGTQGRGRGEYLKIRSFDINTQQQQISLFDEGKYSINIYSYSGKFLRSFDIPENCLVRGFAVLPNGDYLFYCPDYNSRECLRGVWQTDSCGTFKKMIDEIEPSWKLSSITNRPFVHIDDKTIGYMSAEDKDVIYHITNDEVVVKYKINIDMEIPKRLARKKKLDYSKYSNRLYETFCYNETKNIVQFFVSYNDDDVLIVTYDKTNGATYRIYDSKDYLLDESDSIALMPPVEYCDHGYLIGCYPPTAVRTFNEYVKRKHSNFSLESNPIIYL